MHYKTIMLELLRQYPVLRCDLRNGRQWLTALDRYPSGMKDRHTYWIDVLSQQRSQSAPEQFASAALEIAVQEVRDSLPLKADGSLIVAACRWSPRTWLRWLLPRVYHKVASRTNSIDSGSWREVVSLHLADKSPA
jgi:hypothetical protein